ncbi:MAG: hypothetical protein SPI61_04275 [Ezakiella sp.]|uniref:hypothetical protein n=1 Tax=Ezakiella sp. TaxID=1935205 RepID=UPI002A90B6C3|nr:hypothetical protein [Ezakiella sp.]MDY6079917.1 hypothetical protein [Ezakiella sp.]
MIKKIGLIASVLLLSVLLIYAYKNENNDFYIKYISVSNGDKARVHLNGYEKNFIDCDIVSNLNNDLFILLPKNDSEVLISVLNSKSGTYYLAFKSGGNIKKTTFKFPDELLSKIKPEEPIIIDKSIYYTFYPLIFGELEEHDKEILNNSNSSATVKTLENEYFKFDFLLNSSYYEDFVEGGEYLDHRIISSINYNFSLIRFYVKQNENGWRNIPVNYVRDKFEFFLKPTLEIKCNPNEACSIFPNLLPHEHYYKILYFEKDELKEYHLKNESDADLPNTSLIKFENNISENICNYVDLRNPAFKDIAPKLDGTIQTYGIELN